ncbi:putative membrane protein YGL010W [Psychrobacter sp. PL15]|uniref:Mpo1 family 2-hydroxy fatty acid dioxygenase n=1 Tax=unclassified Psychrobacter TaxID=196806 RepID=UPI001AE80D8C|nr:Mpo1-like protein [Psychrobacter sp. PL15]MEC5209388.1 putative membrane protein YGL010W [Psychrobacter sp. PL15]
MARASRKGMSKRTLEQWLSEYAVSHQNLINKKIHWLCVPTIFVSLLGMGMSLSVWFTLVLSALVLLFYMQLSTPLFVAMGVFILICLSVMAFLPWGFKVWASIFIVAWIGQFVGHKLEGKKPSFFEDLQFLLIGPAWVVNSLMKNKQHKERAT